MSQAARAFAVGRDWAREIDDLERLYEGALRWPATEIASSSGLGGSRWPWTNGLAHPLQGRNR